MSVRFVGSTAATPFVTGIDYNERSSARAARTETIGRTVRVDRSTTFEDIDRADRLLKSGEMRYRVTRTDKGGPQ